MIQTPRRRARAALLSLVGAAVLAVSGCHEKLALPDTQQMPRAQDAGALAPGAAGAPAPVDTAPVDSVPVDTAPVDAVPVEPAAAPAPAPTGLSAVEQEIVTLTNGERRANGCAVELAVDPNLMTSARAHAVDMAVNSYHEHNSKNGDTPFVRMEAAGFTGGSMAENIAGGQRSAAEVVRGWMESPGHRQNILNCSYNRVGVGFAENPQDTLQYYTRWVQNFGALG